MKAVSFSSEVKEELVHQLSSGRHCQIAELSALILNSNCRLFPWFYMKTENFRVAKKTAKLIYRCFGSHCQIRVRTYMNHKTATTYELILADETETNRMLQACKVTAERRVNHLIIQKSCCKRAFLRGVFLTSGSVNNPAKSYHFEIACEDNAMALEVQEIMRTFELDAKIVERKKYHVVYLKEGAMIADALNVMEAHRALLNMENVRIWKDVRNQTNRKVNCDIANINKTLSAAQKQIEDIRYIEERKGFGSLSPGLRQVAELRLQEPEISLKELGELLDPPVSKSGVNHRLRKLGEIAENLRNYTG